MNRAKLQGLLFIAFAVGCVALSGCGTGNSYDNDPNPPAADTTPPSVPANLQATAPAPTQVQLTWGASTDNAGGRGLAGYRVYRNGSATPLASPTTNSYADNSVAANTTYTYQVRAFDAATPPNESGLSVTANITTPAAADTTPPSVPANLQATAPTPTQVQLTWAASTDNAGGSGVAGYRVYRNGSATALASPTTNSYTDNTVVANTAYTYRVSAVDAATPPNESAQSGQVSVTTPNVPVSGLDSRPGNTTCLAGAEPTTTLAVTRVFPNLTFNTPVAMLQAPNNASRWYVVQQGGRVRMFDNVPGASTTTDFIDITARVSSGGERGLLGMAFHPNFPTDPRVFLSYTTTVPGPLTSRIAAFTLVSGGGSTLDPNSENVLLTVSQPESNHNGGNIAFGPEGLLYVGFGDGGGGNDQHGPIGNSQNLQTLLGKMLRIDVGGPATTGYTIPATNPFAGTGGMCTSGSTTSPQCREIYAYGLRNPWRWSFDRGGSHDLWVGDVGQAAREEIDRVVSGGNYGWRCREGTLTTANSCPGVTGSFQAPIAEYDNPNVGFSVTGGYVYRGTAIPSLVGRYVFGDYGSGLIWNIPAASSPTVVVTAAQGLSTGGLGISSFGEAVNGELFVVDINGGGLYQLVQGAGGGGGVATQFSATGCGASGNPAQPASGLIPYAPNAGFWSDGADKTRWLALPNGQNIDTSAADHDWNFPPGTVLRKDFSIGTRLVETRLFMRHTSAPNNWAGYTYEWNAAGTEATRVVGGKTVTIGTQDWIFPSEAQCRACHTAAAGRSLGLETGQLNGNLLYPATGRTANQLVTLSAINTLSPPIPDPSTQPVIPDPYGTSGTGTELARAWLHTNCAFCHRPNGPTPSDMDLRYSTPLAATNTCDVNPYDGLGLPNARIVAPGAPGSSVLLARIDTRDPGITMPPLASNLVDNVGVQLITTWINGLATCN